jgi:hypothetical protein
MPCQHGDDWKATHWSKKSNVFLCFANPYIALTLDPILLFNVYIGFVIDPSCPVILFQPNLAPAMFG